jgi:opacity protein-like surface antigen
MGPVKMLALAGVSVLATSTAFAADFPPAMPPMMPQIVQAPPPIETGGWYLRGDVGVGAQTFTDFEHHQTNTSFVWPASWRIDQKELGGTSFVGFGVGYSWNNWLRIDVTGEHRANAKFKVLGSYTEFCPGGRCFDQYDAFHSSNVFLANAYVDFGTWWCLTPFVGVGIGTAYHKINSASDVGFISDGTTGFGFASTDSTGWTMAWAAHAGLAYNVSQNFKVEFAYRYLSMGAPSTAVIDCNSIGCANTGGPAASYTLKNMTSQDLRIGMRWMLQPDVVVPQPVYAPPPPQYSPPPPPYSPPPPLMRRG